MSESWHGKFDAVVYRGGDNPGYWFFKGDECVKVDSHGKQIDAGPYKITDSNAWPILRETVFTTGVDAVTYRDHVDDNAGYWFFKDNECAKTNVDGDEFLVPPAKVTESSRWPILENV